MEEERVEKRRKKREERRKGRRARSRGARGEIRCIRVEEETVGIEEGGEIGNMKEKSMDGGGEQMGGHGAVHRVRAWPIFPPISSFDNIDTTLELTAALPNIN